MEKKWENDGKKKRKKRKKRKKTTRKKEGFIIYLDLILRVQFKKMMILDDFFEKTEKKLHGRREINLLFTYI